ncbi:MAG: hypothetical protein Q8M54_02080 [Desulfobaccales bacterium]|nr:hypothetical protein [Desulfobaccales bacterium]
MRQVGGEYLQEEARARGARPRVKAVLFPFELDYGLAPGSGVYVNTEYGGEPGKLALKTGYYTSGSWTSPVMHTFSPYLNLVAPSWEDQAGDMDAKVYLRTGETPAAVSGSPYALLTRGGEFPLGPYFQVKVAFQQTSRSWAVDSPEEADEFTAYAVFQAPEGGYESYAAEGEALGYLARLRLEGRLALPEGEIMDPGGVRVELARDFGGLKSQAHILVMDNRRGQWLNGAAGFYLQGLDWLQKQVALYHGWELPGGKVQWQLVHQGVIESLNGMAHGWQEPHRARLESSEWLANRLKKVLGAPSPQGEKRPFMRGPYLARVELAETTEASVSDPVKTGSGSAVLKLLGTYRGEYPQDYLVKAETTGEVGAATFRWSINLGQSWKETGLVTAGAEDPVELEEGLSVYWESGPSTDLVAGDQWTFTAQPPVYHYQVPGAPFEAITQVYLNGEETGDRVAAAAATGEILITGRSAQVEARVVKDGTTHPVDIITDILSEVGLSQTIHQDSFALAKSLTPQYAIGVCFENVLAAQALREILRRCLYDLWTDFGEIKIRAYLGEG